MVSQYVLQLGLAVYDAAGNKSAPAATIFGDAEFPVEQGASISPGTTHTFFDGTRSIAADATSILAFTLSPINVDPIYRFMWTGGAHLGLRTSRAVDLSAKSVTMALNANETVTLTTDPGSFTSVVSSDWLFIPGVKTGDPIGPFSEENVGYWVILSKDVAGGVLQLARIAPAGFSGRSETVVVSTAPQLLAFSAGPVQIGDSVDVQAGFSLPILRSYVVSALTPDWFEIVASDPLPSFEQGVAAVPPVFYYDAQQVSWLQVDQEALVVANGVAKRLSPVVPGVVSGQWLSTGPNWSLAVTNRSARVMKAVLRGAS